MVEDQTLFERWCQGDRKAGAELFDRYYEPVARFFHNKVSEAAAPDLIQNTFLACTSARDNFRAEASFRSYLFAIAHNLLRNHFRQRSRDGDTLDFAELSVADLDPSASAIIHARQEQRLLLEALRRISVECQEVLELHYWEEMDTAEIAVVVGVPVGTVKSRLQRGRRLLEERVRELASSPEALESTLGNLEGWAKAVRERVGPQRAL
jgi:RNA polymerase sigma-70 factor (ECF subfamily)